MLKHWLIELIGHASGLGDAQLRQIEKSLPATKALIDLLNKAQPIIEQTQSLYHEAEPLIAEAMKEWQTVGPAAQILIDVISHHVNKGSSPADAAEAVRAALNGSIKTVAQDDWEMSRITVFGGTGFVGRHIVRLLCESGTTVRIASRQPKRPEGANVEQIAADAHDERSVDAAVEGADGVVNAISLYVEHGSDTFHSVHVEAAARIARAARRVGTKRLVHLSGIGRTGCIPWRNHRPSSRDVRAGRRLSYNNSQAASGSASLSGIWRWQHEASAGVRGRRCCGDRTNTEAEQKTVRYLRIRRPARLFIRGAVAGHCPDRRIAAVADADAVCLMGCSCRTR